MNFKPLAVVVACLVASASASAINYSFTMPLSPAAPFSSFVPVSTPGAFTDFWNFTAPTGAIQVASAIIPIDLVPFFNIDLIQVVLFNGSNGSGAVVASGTGLIGETSELTNIAVTAGLPYSFRVTGTVVGAPTGFYSFTAIAAPIPEPSTYALFGAGIVAIGFLAMRRRHT